MILSGILLTPTGVPYKNSSVRITANNTNPDVLQFVSKDFRTTVDGEYEIDVPNGWYSVSVFVNSYHSFTNIGNIEITDETTETTINALLMIGQTAGSDPLVAQVAADAASALVSKNAAAISATNAQNSATASANSATASQTSATNSANSATASANSATSASTSAGTATTKAAESLVSANASATSAAASATSAQEAADVVVTVTEDINELSVSVSALQLDPMNGVTDWSIPAKAFDLVQGVPTFGVITGRLAAWQFPLDTAAYIASPIKLPSHWNTIDVYVQWVNQVANTGNVVWGGEIHQWAIGETINTTPVGGSGIFAANASPWIAVESKVAADLVVNPAKNTTLRIARQGASGNDTLPNSAAIIAVRLVKKT